MNYLLNQSDAHSGYPTEAPNRHTRTRPRQQPRLTDRSLILGKSQCQLFPTFTRYLLSPRKAQKAEFNRLGSEITSINTSVVCDKQRIFPRVQTGFQASKLEFKGHDVTGDGKI